MTAISFDAWEIELARLGAIGDGDQGATCKELAEQFKIPARSMRKILARGVADGRFRPGTGRRVDMRGTLQRVRVYELVPAKPEQKAGEGYCPIYGPSLKPK